MSEDSGLMNSLLLKAHLFPAQRDPSTSTFYAIAAKVYARDDRQTECILAAQINPGMPTILMRRHMNKTVTVISSEVKAAYLRLDEVERSPIVWVVHIFLNVLDSSVMSV